MSRILFVALIGACGAVAWFEGGKKMWEESRTPVATATIEPSASGPLITVPVVDASVEDSAISPRDASVEDDASADDAATFDQDALPASVPSTKPSASHAPSAKPTPSSKPKPKPKPHR